VLAQLVALPLHVLQVVLQLLDLLLQRLLILQQLACSGVVVG
jgi:hypothetical protein